MGERKAWAVVLLAVLGCGRVKGDDPSSPSPSSGGVSSEQGGAVSTAEAGASSQAGRTGGAGASSDAGAGGEGTADCGNSNPGGASLGLAPNVDAQVSKSWTFNACGLIPASKKSALQAVFPPGSGSLAVLYDDGSVLLYPVKSSAAPTVMRAPGSALQGIAFSPDGSQRAEVNAGVVQVRRVTDGTLLRPMALSSDCTGSTLRFSAEGDSVLAWDRSSLCVWQVETGVLTRQLAGTFSSAALAGGRLLTAEYGQPPTVKSWAPTESTGTLLSLELPTETRLFNSVNPPSGDDNGITLSPNADSFIANTQSPKLAQGVSLWAADGTFRATFPSTGYVAKSAYSASGAFVSAGDKLVEVAAARAVFDTPPGRAISAIDERGALAAGVESTSNTQWGAELLDLSGASGPRLLATVSQSAAITDLAVSPDGSRLITTAIDGGLLWRVAADFGASEAIHALNVNILFEANFTKDGRQLLLSGDGWAAFSPDDGHDLAQTYNTEPPPPDIPPFDDQNCVHTSARVSSRGTWLAIGEYAASTQIFSRSQCPNPSFELPTAHCNARSAFSADDRLIAVTGPALYRTSDGSRIWPALIDRAGPGDLFGDVQFMPGEKALLASNCPGSTSAADPACKYALYSVSDGSQIQALPELSGAQAAVSAEGHWVVSGGTALHLPSGQLRSFDPDALLATFAPNGDIIAVRKDNSIARYCRSP